MIVRPATLADLPAVVAISNAAIATGHAHFAHRAWTLAEAEASLAAAGPRHPTLVADDGAVRGFAKASPWKARGGYAWTVEVGVYVADGARGQGIGRALYDVFLPLLRARGVRCVLAGIALPNPASVALHEAYGFARAGVLPKVGWKDGAWRDVGYWAKTWGGDEPGPGVVPGT